MLFWLPPNAPCGGDENEKAAKLRRRARAKFMNILFATGLVLAILSLAIFNLHHSPKMRGAYSRQKQQQQQQQQGAATLPLNSMYRLSVETQEGGDGILTSLLKYTGMVTLVVNTACK